MSNDPIRNASVKVLGGLKQMLPSDIAQSNDPISLANIAWMIDQCLVNIETFPIDKTSRWIGFIQGVLACNGLLNVVSERNRTRPIFHEAYLATGQAIPETSSKPC